MNGEVGEQLRAVTALYCSAVRARDVDAFVGLYADSVRVFDAWGTWSYVGIVEWRAAAVRWFDSLGADTVEVHFSEIATEDGAEVAALNSIVSYADHAETGERLRSMENRITWVLIRRAGAWRIVHEHSSAPINFIDMKPILHRGR